MVCAINKIDSNVTGLAFAEEECLKVLPGVAEANAIWYDLEPNSYSDFGGNISTTARSPIDPGRQNKKGTVTDLDASGGFNIDVTKSNLKRIMQGFYFAKLREKADTRPHNGTTVALTSATATTYVAASGLGVFLPTQLVLATGFGVLANNGLKLLSAATGTTLTTTGNAVEASPPAAARIIAVGNQFASGDVAITVASGIPTLTATAFDFTTLGLIVGEWIFLGGDTAGTNRFANNVGYARIKSIAAKAIVFDDTTWTPVAEAGGAFTIRMFYGTVIRNEKTPSLIVRTSYNIERTLGLGANDVQAEYLVGAVANEYTLNLPKNDKINADLTFIACDNTQRSGDVGDLRKVGAHTPVLAQSAYNTSLDLYRVKLNILDATTSKPTSLFAFVDEATISISNGVTPQKALGVLGSFDTTIANFTVSGSITAYFATTAAVKAVRQNADVGFNVIVAAANAGQVYDIPLLSLGGGRVNVTKDQAIMIPLEPQAAENVNGYTAMQIWFEYLPTVAMPVLA